MENLREIRRGWMDTHEVATLSYLIDSESRVLLRILLTFAKKNIADDYFSSKDLTFLAYLGIHWKTLFLYLTVNFLLGEEKTHVKNKFNIILLYTE